MKILKQKNLVCKTEIVEKDLLQEKS